MVFSDQQRWVYVQFELRYCGYATYCTYGTVGRCGGVVADGLVAALDYRRRTYSEERSQLAPGRRGRTETSLMVENGSRHPSKLNSALNLHSIINACMHWLSAGAWIGWMSNVKMFRVGEVYPRLNVGCCQSSFGFFLLHGTLLSEPSEPWVLLLKKIAVGRWAAAAHQQRDINESINHIY